ncbi:MAG: hypothetical protein SFW67_34710 [Myxococcaceae bacterium]|nr:hypothetical protein [Myxococcaceae bacterium]
MTETLNELPLTDAVLATLVAIGLPAPSPGSPLYRTTWPEPDHRQLAIGRLFLAGCGMLESDEATPTEGGERLWLALEALCEPAEQVLVVKAQPGSVEVRTLLAIADEVIAPLHLMRGGMTVGAAMSRDELMPLLTKAWSAEAVDRAPVLMPSAAFEILTRVWARAGHDVRAAVDLATLGADEAAAIREVLPQLEALDLVTVVGDTLALRQELKRPLRSLWQGPRLEVRSMPLPGDTELGLSEDQLPHVIVVGEEGRRYCVLTSRSPGGAWVAEGSVAFVPLTTELLREQLDVVVP